MKLISKSHGQKGETSLMYIVVAVLIVAGVIYAVKYYQDRNRDIVIHVPHVEVH